MWKVYIMGLGRPGHVYGFIEATTYKRALNLAVKYFPQQHTSRFRLERV